MTATAMRKSLTYYKATRPDGTDFQTGSIDYAAALATGETIEHPAAKMVRHDPATYLSVSIHPANCTGMRWPCRPRQTPSRSPARRMGRPPRSSPGSMLSSRSTSSNVRTTNTASGRSAPSPAATTPAKPSPAWRQPPRLQPSLCD